MKFIQISAVFDANANEIRLFALDDDGQVWQCAPQTSGARSLMMWRRVGLTRNEVTQAQFGPKKK